MAQKTGISLSGIQRIKLGNATDILTPPQLKTECSHISPIIVFGWDSGATYCDGWTSYKKVMNCEWYITAPNIGDAASFDVKDMADEAIKVVIKKITNYIEERIRAAIDRTLVNSGASAAVAGFTTSGAAAVNAFFITFSSTIIPELNRAKDEIKEYIAGMSFLKSVSFPGADQFSNPTESCAWSEWTPL